ncbi:SsgA family sporulation/cell division regulator [Nonomuraea sp. NPDC026600]|uniref:SsgA family sporulation/cell division regulator n=1 Tax=Nonomuraea sp. NPDC026600 TaxID=3155363 RepID=UPI0034067DA3
MSTVPEMVEDLTLWPATELDRPLVAMLSYRADNPHVVRMAFVDACEHETPFIYTFAPGLLARALGEDLTQDLAEPAGDGEVHIGPTEVSGRLVLSLIAPDLLRDSGGRFELLVERARLQAVAEQIAAVRDLAGLGVGS